MRWPFARSLCKTLSATFQTMWCDSFGGLAKSKHSLPHDKKPKGKWEGLPGYDLVMQTLCALGFQLSGDLGLHRLSFPPSASQLFMSSEQKVIAETQPNNKSEIGFYLFGNIKTSVVQVGEFSRKCFPILEFLKNWELLLKMTFSHIQWMCEHFSSLTKALD